MVQGKACKAQIFGELARFHAAQRTGYEPDKNRRDATEVALKRHYVVWLANQLRVSVETVNDYLAGTTSPPMTKVNDWLSALGIEKLADERVRLHATWELYAAVGKQVNAAWYDEQLDDGRARLGKQFGEQLKQYLPSSQERPRDAADQLPVAPAGHAQLLAEILERWRSPMHRPPCPTPAEILDTRKADLGRAFGHLLGPAGEALAWIPPGWLRLPDGTELEVARPVAMMSQVVSRAHLGAMAGDDGADPALEAAIGVSREDAHVHVQRLNQSDSQRLWRLPTLAEWWMAVTAGRTRLPDPGSSSGFWLDQLPFNEWRVQSPPPGLLEWVTGDPSLDGVVGGRGERRAVRTDVRHGQFGYRLVLDCFVAEPVWRSA